MISSLRNLRGCDLPDLRDRDPLHDILSTPRRDCKVWMGDPVHMDLQVLHIPRWASDEVDSSKLDISRCQELSSIWF